ncbi:GspE/PulE family protein [Vibrio algicola]|uniref:GspE/PulE family protein n=1 Tax=Vibrio algicola TaxID=2662262 RepID=UPI0015B48F6C|nr:ATPase, T2SS/T4P/T4SS family [Vibrio algicola]
MEKLLIDDKLRNFYYTSPLAIAVTSGKILVTDYSISTIDGIRDHIKNNDLLANGHYLGQLLSIEKVSKGIIDGFLDGGLNRTSIKKDIESGSETLLGESYKDILTKAANLGCSDIHLELYETELQIYAEIDGIRRELIPTIPDAEHGHRLFSYIWTSKAKNKDSDYIRHTPNNGSLEENLLITGDMRLTNWRASYIPTNKGGKVTLRWLNKNVSLPQLTEIGWTPGHVAAYKEYLNFASGVCVIAGKTGSGKSTTLACGLKLLDKSRAVHTLEDPVEFNLGIPQTLVNPNKTINDEAEARGAAYYSKVLLRHAVNVEMHGEIRDHKGAMELIRKGETGQLMFTTVHTSSALGIAPTFIEQFNVSASVMSAPDLMRLWIYQTLIRTLCSECSFTQAQAQHYYDTQDSEEDNLYFEQLKIHTARLCGNEINNIRYKNPNGCHCCGYEGEKGRTAVVEMIVLDDEDREFIFSRNYLGWKEALLAKGFKDVRWHTITKIKAGLIDIDTASKRVNNLLPVAAKEVYSSFIDTINESVATKSEPGTTEVSTSDGLDFEEEKFLPVLSEVMNEPGK